MTESYSVEAILSVYDNGFSNGFKQAQASMQQATQSSNTMGSGILKNSAAFGVASTLASKAMSIVTNSLGGAISRFDTLNKYPVVMHALGYSMNDVSKSTKLLSNGIDGLPTSLDEITSSAQQLAPLVGSSQKAAKSALALNNAFLASGASAGDASRGLIQYTQMLSTGKVDMMSWRTLMETMPSALDKVAKSFGFTGKSAKMDLYNALQSGQITIDQLNDRFIKLNGGVNGFADLAKKNSAGIATSLINLKNSVIKNLTEMIKAINTGFSKAGFGSIAQQLDNLKYAINGFFKIIGPNITNMVTVGLKALQYLFNFVEANRDWLGPLTVGILGGFYGFRILTNMIITATNVWETAMNVFNTGKALIGIAKGSKSASSALRFMAQDSKIAAAAQAALNAVAELNPYVLIATAIIAVGAALTYWFTQTESGKQAWASLCKVATQAWNAFYPIIKPAIDGIVQAWNSLVAAFKQAWATLQPVFQQLGSAISSAFSALAPIIQQILPILSLVGQIIGGILVGSLIVLIATISGVIQMVSAVLQVIIPLVQAGISLIIFTIGMLVSGVMGAWNGIMQITSSIWNGIVQFIQGIWNIIKGIFDIFGGILNGDTSQIWNGIREVAVGAWQLITAPIKAVWGVIKGLFNAGAGFIKGAVNFSLSSHGQAIMNSFLSGLKAAWGAVKNFVGGIASWIKKHKGPISYDRKLLVPAGKAIMTGLNSGLNSTFGTVQDTVESIAGAITDAMDISSNISYNGLDNLATIGQRTFTGNYQGSMKLQDTNLQLQNNALLRQIANKESSIYLDGDTLVGGTIDRTNQQLGNRVQLQSRWS
ncbi:tape measure protein [Ligilactobacillus salivarius]|uniref:Tape measure protein n=1 Tax=Ligilactobacillus salivarius TaxID=1624 RepID=A0AAW6PZX5_9LACO|nr:tape measure protein [Ligilactobacillus salivarius]MDF4185961.1 tape measure protein [Ligilactobacillus salivarius]